MTTKGTIDRLVEVIGCMSYCATSKFLYRLSEQVKEGAEAKRADGKDNLAARLSMCSHRLYTAAEAMDSAYRLKNK